METVNKKLTHRQRQAKATQQLIVETATQLFLAQGYGATTIDAIATEAGVAVSTVYAVFGSKRGILREIRMRWHEQSGQRTIYEQARQEASPARQLEMAAYATRRQWEASSSMVAIYNSAAAIDTEAAAEREQSLNGRRTNLSTFIMDIYAGLRQDIAPEQAAARFLALTKAEIYDELVKVAGWTPDEYERWLAETLQQQLLP